jgi:RES domain-containing protein
VASEQVALQPSAPGSLTVFRYTDYDVPFWSRPNTRAGRWNVVGDEPTQYWSMTPDGAWAELIRANELRTEEELDLVRMPLWVCRLPGMSLVDLHHADAQQTHGISTRQMIEDDWRPCQAVATELRRHCRAIIAPNPALDGHANLTLFGARRAIDWRTKPALASTVPAARTGVGRPPRGLVSLVRRRSGSASQAPLFGPDG